MAPVPSLLCHVGAMGKEIRPPPQPLVTDTVTSQLQTLGEPGIFPECVCVWKSWTLGEEFVSRNGPAIYVYCIVKTSWGSAGDVAFLVTMRESW